MIEKVLFFILTFAMAAITVAKFIKRPDKTYVILGVFEVIGFIIRLITMDAGGAVGTVIAYCFCIIVPVAVFLLELKHIYLSETFGIFMAKLYVKAGNNEFARKRLIKIISKYPNSYLAHKLLAQIYEKEGKDEYAIGEYVKIVELNSKDYDSYYQIAYLLNKTNKRDESEKMLLDLLKKKPEYYKASELLGSILYDKEKFLEAAAVYQKALEYNPTRYELYYGLRMAYTRLNDFQTAKEYYEKAAKLNSMLFHAKLNIAQIALIMGDLDEAEDELLECVQDQDSEGYAYYYLAIIALFKGDKDRALNYLNIAIELDNNVYKLIYKHDIFVSICDKISVKEAKIHKYRFTRQEKKTRDHLDDTFILTQKLKMGGKGSSDSNGKKIKEQDKQREEY